MKKIKIEHYCEKCQQITQFDEIGNQHNEKHKCKQCSKIFK